MKRIPTVLICISVFIIVIFALPNAVGSENLAMVEVFEPDEAVPLSVIVRMITPTGDFKHTIFNFFFYQFYHYGFPYFASSALVLLPIQWLGQLGNTPLVMLVLRQTISVLPLIAALLLLVYMQDGFRTYRSVLLFLFMLSVPAVVQNNFWWHPDGLVLLFTVLMLFFLNKDKFHFGLYFYLAAFVSGISMAIKLIGIFSLVPVGFTLFIAWTRKTASWKTLLTRGIMFVVILCVSFIFANTFLLSGWARMDYINTIKHQSNLLTEGYGVIYTKGLFASWSTIREFYGEALFLITTFAVLIWGLWKARNRDLFALVVVWFIPLSLTVFLFSHFKFQYWIPVMLPVFSCWAFLLPDGQETIKDSKLAKTFQIVALSMMAFQFAFFVRDDIGRYQDRLHRAELDPSIQFYDFAVQELNPLQDMDLHIYRDYRMYFPFTSGWTAETNYELLDYSYIHDRNFDVLLLMEQRIRDYLNPEVQGIDSDQFALNQLFYRDAEVESIDGYRFIYRNSFGLIFVRDDLYEQYYHSSQ